MGGSGGKELAARVIALRERHPAQPSQEELAELAGIAAKTVWRVENGYKVSLSTLERLATALDLSLPDLLALDQVPVSQTTSADGVSQPQTDSAPVEPEADMTKDLLLRAFAKLSPQQQLDFVEQMYVAAASNVAAAKKGAAG